jgi:4-diphosphocytidyl-2-C-methyl-D-erythritol kinase
MLCFAPAKVNLHLDVGPVGNDGFHRISSIFLMVDLCDLVEVEIAGRNGRISITGNSEVPDSQDTMRSAAATFLSNIGKADGVRIRVCKRIPIGAGLGGGSSDAASVLVALNGAYGNPLDHDQLLRIAGEIGSDVPFFLEGPAAMVGGRGEVLDSFVPPRTWWVLLVDPGFGVSTREAFVWFDAGGYLRKPWSPDLSVKERFAHGRPAQWGFSNSFTEVLSARYPELGSICDAMTSAMLASVTGSGSVCFGLFDRYEEAARAAAGLSGYRSWVKETLASSPGAVLQ